MPVAKPRKPKGDGTGMLPRPKKPKPAPEEEAFVAAAHDKGANPPERAEQKEKHAKRAEKRHGQAERLASELLNL